MKFVFFVASVHIAWFQNKFGLLTLNGNKVDVGDVGEDEILVGQVSNYIT